MTLCPHTDGLPKLGDVKRLKTQMVFIQITIMKGHACATRPEEAREDGVLLVEAGLKSPDCLFWKDVDWQTKTRSVSLR